MKKTLARLLLLVMALTLACSGAMAYEFFKDPGEETYDWKQDTTPIDLTLLISTSSVFDCSTIEYLNDIREDTGINLIIETTGDNDGTGATLRLAAGDLPDMVQLWDISTETKKAFINQAIASESIYALDDLLQYVPHYEDHFVKEVMNNYATEDGKTYAFYSAIYGEEYYDAIQASGCVTNAETFSIRSDWWEEIGSPEMTDPDKWVAAIKQIMENHPEMAYAFIPHREGDWPYAWFEFGRVSWDNYFGNEYFHINEDGTVTDQAYNQQARDASLFTNRLYLEGILSKDVTLSTFDRSAYTTEGLVAVVGGNSSGNNTAINGTDAVYTTLKPFDTNISYTTADPGDYRPLMITKNCEHPDRAIQLMEYLSSYYFNKKCVWGVEGTLEDDANFDQNDYSKGPHYYINSIGKATVLPSWKQAYSNDWSGAHSKAKIGENPMINEILLYGQIYWDNSDEWGQLLTEWFGGKTQVPAPQFAIEIPASNEELTDISTKIDEIKKDYAFKIIFAESAEEANAQYDAMLAEMEAAGEAKLDAFYTEQYNANLAKLAD